jgi:hypothetical protein
MDYSFAKTGLMNGLDAPLTRRYRCCPYVGLALSIKRAMGESFLNEVMAQIRRAVDFASGNWISSLVLCLTEWPKLVLGCADRAPCRGFTYCTEMTG